MNIKTKFEIGDKVRFKVGENGSKKGEIGRIEINKKGIVYLICTPGLIYEKKEAEIEKIN